MHTLNMAVSHYLTVVLLWMVIAIFGVSIVALFISLGFHKRHTLKRSRLFQQQVDLNERALTLLLAGDESPLPTVHDLEQVSALGSALTKKLGSTGTADPVLLGAIRKTGAPAIALRALDAQDWAQRYRAVSACGDLRLPELFAPVVEFAYAEENMKIFGICLYAGAHLVSEPSQVKTLFDLTSSRPDLSTGYDEGMFRIAIQSLQRLGIAPERLNAALEYCLRDNRADEQHLLALILAIGQEQLVCFKDTLVRMARLRGHERLTAATLRSLQSMELCDSMIGEHIGAANLMLNIAAIRAAESCGPDIVSQVSEQLASPDFNVRYAAAQTLMNMGAYGHRALLERQEDTRPEVRHMAAFALAAESR
ncbi:MAG: HEAT repeat domain-containing protein [Gammaproteobacteria bacterium]